MLPYIDLANGSFHSKATETTSLKPKESGQHIPLLEADEQKCQIAGCKSKIEVLVILLNQICTWSASNKSNTGVRIKILGFLSVQHFF